MGSLGGLGRGEQTALERLKENANSYILGERETAKKNKWLCPQTLGSGLGFQLQDALREGLIPLEPSWKQR